MLDWYWVQWESRPSSNAGPDGLPKRPPVRGFEAGRDACIEESCWTYVISFGYGRRGEVLRSVSLHVPQARIVGMIGPNGSGKRP